MSYFVTSCKEFTSQYIMAFVLLPASKRYANTDGAPSSMSLFCATSHKNLRLVYFLLITQLCIFSRFIHMHILLYIWGLLFLRCSKVAQTFLSFELWEESKKLVHRIFIVSGTSAFPCRVKRSFIFELLFVRMILLLSFNN